ncbi:MAG: bifunctional YncE family protein/alkaline phosphatase family protein [Lewinellaceae bacterium]|nr:bifunctional YncE family protein/alkaline phosphatase family protein [Lewinellaceae bacterium]
MNTKQLLYLFLGTLFMAACDRQVGSGPLAEGPAIPRIFLPNGWALTPAGEHLDLGDLPLNLLLTPDGKRAVATNNGQSENSLTLVDLDNFQAIQSLPLPKAWYGLAWHPNGQQLFASGGYDNCVRMYSYTNDRLAFVDSISLARPWPKDTICPAGMVVDPAGKNLFTVSKDGRPGLFVIDLAAKRLLKRVDLPAEAYTCLLAPDGKHLYISLWGGSAVGIYDVVGQELQGTIPVARHPNEMVLSPDGNLLYVACADDNAVAVVNLAEGKMVEVITTSLYPDAPTGSTANSLALSADGDELYVANADNNCLAVFDVEAYRKSKSLGFIPTGWYPTAVRVANGKIYVANGKGNTGSRANPGGPNPYLNRTPATEYIAGLFKGSLSVLPAPDEETMAGFTRLVYQNTPYSKDKELRPAGIAGNPIPNRVGKPSPIKYVFYIIKENRTYDQILGDMPEGNGDPSLCLFPEKVTPNIHALAREFVLLDNFYVDAEVSADGHNWSTAAYANDYVEKTWPTNYGGRGGTYDYEGRKPIAYPRGGFLWDYANRAGVSYRTYGEFANLDQTYLESLKGHACARFPGYNLSIQDQYRFEQWKIDFDSLLALNAVPRLNIVRFANDHTSGARGGAPTPAAMVADNDLAVGRFVDYISHSPIWKEAAIFVVEDDAQNGPDHVDAHRSPALVISPYTRRNHVEHTMYSTASLLRTMELILGLPPMSQYDAAATPMFACFTREANVKPYQHLPARISLDDRNAMNTRLSDLSYTLNLDKEDQAPDLLFNEIIWKAVRGEHSEMPPPRRAAFLRIAESDEDDED